MTPVATLAQQQFRNLYAPIPNMPERLQPSATLLPGSTRAEEKRAILEKLASCEVQILVGTHSLLAEGVDFKSLGLAVVDEQQK